MAEYIEREAALKANCYFCSAHLEDDAPCVEKCADYMKFIEIPAADVREVRKSKWFDGACVNCGFKPALDYEYATVYDDYNEYRWNFCPNCGADMRPQPPKEE